MTVDGLTSKGPATSRSRVWSGAMWCGRIVLALFFVLVDTAKLAGAQQLFVLAGERHARRALPADTRKHPHEERHP